MRALSNLATDDTFVCFGDRQSLEAYPDPAGNVRLIEVALQESPVEAASSTSSRSPRDLLRLTRAVGRERLDAFLSPSVYTYFPLPLGLPSVVTIHDTIPERFPHLTLPSRRARLFWAVKVRFALAQARIVLTVSDYSARLISDQYGVDPARIRVAVEAPAATYRPSSSVDVEQVRQAFGLPASGRWFVYVGGFNPHKRLDVVLRAHARVARDFADNPPHLLLVGTRSADVFHHELGQLDAIVAAEGTGSLVHWVGFVEDETLRHLLSGAEASLLPSEAEGFGLPSVEAAACGTPVIATTESPLPELLAGGGFFVKPGDIPAVQSAMSRLLSERGLRAELGAIAEARAAALSWDRTAQQTRDAIRSAAGH